MYLGNEYAWTANVVLLEHARYWHKEINDD